MMRGLEHLSCEERLKELVMESVNISQSCLHATATNWGPDVVCAMVPEA